jgi:uncharacterized membrane protein YjjB (DUF3815 family)
MNDRPVKNAALAALIVLAPGGLILGGVLGARYLRKRAAAKAEEAARGPR